MSLKYYNLHGHTSFSIFDSVGSVEDYVKWSLKNAGEDSGGFAVTDHANMSAVGYINAAQRKYKDKIKITYGIEAYYNPSISDWAALKEKRAQEKKEQKEDKKQQKEEAEDELVVEDERESKGKDYSKWFDPINRKNHLVLCAYNQKGLENLFRLTSRSYREGFYRKPRIDFDMLKTHNEGLIASTACLHPDTVLVTSLGRITIKDVVHKLKNSEELSVLSFDPETKKIVFNRVVWGDVTRRASKLFKIKLKNGKELKLTPDHRVYTDRGWVAAEHLTKKDKILSIK